MCAPYPSSSLNKLRRVCVGRFLLDLELLRFLVLLGRDGDGKRGPAGHPLELKLLSSLRVMAKGCDFEAVSEVALISPQTLEVFHWQWLKWAVEHLFPKWVKWPSDAEALSFMGECPLHSPPMLLPFHVSRASLSLQISGLGWASQALSAPSMVCTAPGRGALWG